MKEEAQRRKNRCSEARTSDRERREIAGRKSSSDCVSTRILFDDRRVAIFRFCRSNSIDQSRDRSEPDRTGGKIIGFTSSVPNEGKSSIAVCGCKIGGADRRADNIGRLRSQKSVAVALIIAESYAGLLEVLRGQSTLEKAIWLDRYQYAIFAGGYEGARWPIPAKFLHRQTRKFFDSLRRSYDYIIVDFSPLMPIVDVRASTNLVDSYIYVVAWGRTRIDYVEQALICQGRLRAFARSRAQQGRVGLVRALYRSWARLSLRQELFPVWLYGMSPTPIV